MKKTHKTKGQIVAITIDAYRSMGAVYAVVVARKYKNGKRAYADHYIPNTSRTILMLNHYMEEHTRTWVKDVSWYIFPSMTFRMRK